MSLSFAPLPPNLLAHLFALLQQVILTTHPSGDPDIWMKSMWTTWTAFAPFTNRPFTWLVDMNSWVEGTLGEGGCRMWQNMWQYVRSDRSRRW